MEIKLNKDILKHSETLFMGLTMRQSLFSALAIIVAVLLYFGLKPYCSNNILSWVCILGAFPFAVMGFFKYQGMTAEQFAWVWIRAKILEPKVLNLEPRNHYYDAVKASIMQAKKEEYRNDDAAMP